MKRFVLAFVLIVFLSGMPLLAFASSEDTDTTNWSQPITSHLAAFQLEENYFSTEATAQWSQDQLQLFQSDEVTRKFFPSLTLTADSSDRLIPKLIMTNLPGAKFTIQPANEGSGQSVRVSPLATMKMKEGKTYHFSVVWFRDGNKDASVTLHSARNYAQPNGTLNELSGTDDQVLAVKLSDASVKKRDYPRAHKFPVLNKKPLVATDERSQPKKARSYSSIDSKEALARYKQDSADQLSNASGGWNYFAVTFNRPTAPESVNRLVKENDLEVAQVHAIGIKENGEVYSVSWYDSDLSVLELLRGTNFKQFFVTELEGVGMGDDLRRLQNDPDVDTVEVENKDGLPTGIFDLNERFVK